ncbi:hypothetical protein EDB86DRAFT_3087255 [Lactarius hatsudake]|nr:hypothetical protein EDB86DRAFT_3087255 [Lactarius hatsudake]
MFTICTFGWRDDFVFGRASNKVKTDWGLASWQRRFSQARGAVWEKREDPEGEELFYDKENIGKKPKLTGLTCIVGLGPPPHRDAVVCPKERAAIILARVDREMTHIEERDHHWIESPKLSGTSNGFPHLNRLEHRRHLPLLSSPPSIPAWRAVRMTSLLSDMTIPTKKDRALVDDFAQGDLLKGMSIYQEDSHQRLTTDLPIYTLSPDGRLSLIGRASLPHFVATPLLFVTSRPSYSFPGRNDAPVPDDGGVPADRIVALGAERYTAACLVQQQPTPSCGSPSAPETSPQSSLTLTALNGPSTSV